ncbi:MAG TPA: winged helix DNA-binding domain-containing protein [Candidatus Limnocylindrales bacterium]|nr:winged helix DNA-binding domain-containing protein [Candidatus Limnocylindrales bacterium]
MRRMTVAERRARLGLRHRLAAHASSPLEVARSLVALHATDPATVFLSVLARQPDATVEAIENALYEERTLLRLHGMRRTIFVAPVELAPPILHSCVHTFVTQSRKTYVQALTAAGIGDDDWLSEVEAAAEAALAKRGTATASQISSDEPRMLTKVRVAAGKSYESTITITAWILFLLAAEGRIARGRPSGSWTSSQWTWSPMGKWLPGGMPDMPAALARAELARAWLGAFGPATVADLKWWTGWTVGHAKQALTAVGAVEVDLDGVTGFGLPQDLDAVGEQPPWVALLPALDPTPMGWAQRQWYLGEHTAAVFDNTGNAGPTVWCDGRVVGGWAQLPSGEVVYKLLEDVGTEAKSALDTAADHLTRWLGGVRLSPRTRRKSLVEKDLLA